MLPGEDRMQRNMRELARMMNGKLWGDGYMGACICQNLSNHTEELCRLLHRIRL